MVYDRAVQQCSKIQSTVRWKHNLFPMHSRIMSCMFARCGNAAIQEVAPKNVAMLGLQQLIGPSLTEHLPWLPSWKWSFFVCLLASGFLSVQSFSFLHLQYPAAGLSSLLGISSFAQRVCCENCSSIIVSSTLESSLCPFYLDHRQTQDALNHNRRRHCSGFLSSSRLSSRSYGLRIGHSLAKCIMQTRIRLRSRHDSYQKELWQQYRSHVLLCRLWMRAESPRRCKGSRIPGSPRRLAWW